MRLRQATIQHTFLIGCTFGNILAPLNSSDELRALDAAIWSSPEIAKQANQVVGSALSSHRVDLNDIRFYTVGKALNRSLQAFNIEEFDADYMALEDALYSGKLTYTRVTVLRGARMPIESIQLTDNTTIKRLTGAEMAEWMAKGLNLAYESNWEKHRFVGEFCDLVFETKLVVDKRIGATDDYTLIHREAEKMREKEAELLFICVCRLVRDGLLYLANRQWECSSPLLGGVGEGLTAHGFPAATWVASEVDVNEIRALWPLVWEHRKSRRFLTRSIERFSSSLGRETLEDRIIDLAIAGESIFLSGEGSGNELTFRLSHRAAAFLGADRAEMVLIFGLFKRFYELRSKVVHGVTDLTVGSPKLEDAKSTTQAISDYLRRALKKAVSSSKNCVKPTQLVDDWNDLLFPLME